MFYVYCIVISKRDTNASVFLITVLHYYYLYNYEHNIVGRLVYRWVFPEPGIRPRNQN